jgi:surface antigen
MNPHPYLSSYLTVAPAKAPHIGNHRLRNRAAILWTSRPRLTFRTWGALTLWAVLASIGLYAFKHHTIPNQHVAVASQAITPSSVPTAKLASNTKASTLPGGPTGQTLPPGTMAPMGTFANGYMRGQCTWYVASRRPLPNNWGNARTWFSHAQGAGYQTGTTPAIAAIAWTSAGFYGHVALVEAIDEAKGEVLISEMNYYGPYQYSKRWVKATAFKYIY